MRSIIRIATRKSPLALWQAHTIAQQLEQYWPTISTKLVPLVTSGDRFLNDKLIKEGGKGLFVKELEEALLEKRADIAVHSMKDVPSELPSGLILHTICKRDNPFDVLISKNHLSLADLPEKAIIGTSSLRRQAQLLAYRNDLRIQGIRGNIQTRLEKLKQEPFDAIVLAAAALERMNLQNVISETLAPPLLLPACGQGALGIECRIEDEATQTLLAPLQHETTSLCVRTERRVNALLGGNCHVPLAVYCYLDTFSQQLVLHSKVLSPDGQIGLSIQCEDDITAADRLAEYAVSVLIAQGANQLLSSI